MKDSTNSGSAFGRIPDLILVRRCTQVRQMECDRKPREALQSARERNHSQKREAAFSFEQNKLRMERLDSR